MGIVVVWLICGGLGALIAGSKNRDRFGWFMLGVLLGPLGVIVAACMSTLDDPDAEVEETRVCPHCAETVKRAAIVCRYCSRDLEPLGAAPAPAIETY